MFSFLKIAKQSEDSSGYPSTTFNQGKVFAALFYGISSILVIFTNKAVLTQYNFPYFKFVATVQFVATVVILLILSAMKKIDIPYLSLPICKEILPISVMFLGNVLCGLGSTKSLNIPMFTALRRFSILMTMFGEWCVLNSKPSTSVVISVSLMVGGAMIAAMYDLSYDTMGYTMVFFNNIFTALNGVWMKKASMSGKCSKMGVLFYNSLFSAFFMFIYFVAEHSYYSQAGQHFLSSSSNGAIPLNELPNIPQRNLMLNRNDDASNLLRMRGITLQEPQQFITNSINSIYNLPIGVRQLNEIIGSIGMNNAINSASSSTVDSGSGRGGGIYQYLPTSVSVGLRGPPIRNSLVSNAKSASAANSADSVISVQSKKIIDAILGEVRTDKLSHDNDANAVLPATIQQQQQQQHPPPPHDVGKPSAVHDSGTTSTWTKITQYEGWTDPHFLMMLSITCCMGSILNYAIFLCTTMNSALTTAVVGTLKNVLTTYIGMLLFNDYAFTWVNFAGINISILGSLYYTYCTLKS